MSITWCVAHTQPSKELVAKQHLLDQGYEAYLPRFKKICRHARKIEERLVPLFPRYIFIGMDLSSAKWGNINNTRGISYLLMSDTTNPAKVPTPVINELRAQEIGESIVAPLSLINFIKGKKVRVLEGAFREQIAIFESMDDKSRVQLLLTFMGREMKMILPMYAVEAA